MDHKEKSEMYRKVLLEIPSAIARGPRPSQENWNLIQGSARSLLIKLIMLEDL